MRRKVLKEFELMCDYNYDSFQCDQIEILFVQYLSINSNKILPKSIENLPKYGKNDAQY